MLTAPVSQRLLISEPYGHTSQHHCFLKNPANCRQNALGSPGISPNQPASTQLNTTKVSDNNHQYIAHVFVLNYAEDGFSGGSGRLAIIAHGGFSSGSWLANLIGPANMPGVRMILTRLIDPGSHIFTGADWHYPRNKAAFFNLRFTLQETGRNGVVFAHCPRHLMFMVMMAGQVNVNTGRRAVICKPPDSIPDADSSPSCAVIMSRAIVRPNPQPRPPRDGSARKNGSNRLVSNSPETPGP